MHKFTFPLALVLVTASCSSFAADTSASNESGAKGVLLHQGGGGSQGGQGSGGKGQGEQHQGGAGGAGQGGGKGKGKGGKGQSGKGGAGQGGSSEQTGGGGGGKGKGKGGRGSQLSLPLKPSGLHGTFGGYHTYPNRKQQAYYNVGYGNSTLFTQGSTFTGTSIADSDPIDFGGEPIDLSIASGSTKLGGTVVHNLNTIPLNAFDIKPLAKAFRDPSLRVILGYDGQTEQQPQQHVLIGAEYRPHLNTAGAPVAMGAARSKPQSGSDEERFIGVGFGTEHHVDTTQNINVTVPAIVYQGRLGIGFSFAVSQHRLDAARQGAQTALGQIAQAEGKLKAQIAHPELCGLAQANQDRADFEKALDNARNIAGRFGMAPPDTSVTAMGAGPPPRLSLADLSRQLDNEPRAMGPLDPATVLTDLDGLASVYKSYLGLKDEDKKGSVFKDSPRISLYTEFDGAYALKDPKFYSRWRSIWSLNLRLDLDPTNPGFGFILVRYENGFGPAEPNLRSTALTVTFGFSLP